jgi:hypothetical protein
VLEAEHHEDAVADELVEHTPVGLDLLEHRAVELVELPDHLVGRERLAHRGEPAEVGRQERDGDQPPAERERGVGMVAHHPLHGRRREVPAQ